MHHTIQAQAQSLPITLHNLSIGYGHRTVATALNATAPPASLTCIIGRNGQGKSTLLRTLAALQPPVSGEARMGNNDTTRMTHEETARTVGIVLTARPEAADITVDEMVALGRTPYTGFWGRLNDNDRNIVAQAIRRVGIEHLATRRVRSLSDGECQKAMIAKTLAQQTPFILLDEPTAFLDFAGKIELMRLLGQLAHNEGKTIVMSTHDLETALHTADHLWIMQEGGISEGTPEQLAERGDIEHYIGRDDVTVDRHTLNIVLKIKE